MLVASRHSAAPVQLAVLVESRHFAAPVQLAVLVASRHFAAPILIVSIGSACGKQAPNDKHTVNALLDPFQGVHTVCAKGQAAGQSLSCSMHWVPLC